MATRNDRTAQLRKERAKIGMIIVREINRTEGEAKRAGARHREDLKG